MSAGSVEKCTKHLQLRSKTSSHSKLWKPEFALATWAFWLITAAIILIMITLRLCWKAPVTLVNNCARDLERFPGDGVASAGSKQFSASTDYCYGTFWYPYSREAHCTGSSCHKLRRELTLDRETSQFFATRSLRHYSHEWGNILFLS